MDAQKQLAHRLRAAREAARLTQRDVAARLGIHQPSVVVIESGKRAVTALELARMARLYGVSADTLLGTVQ
jgi:transcriptional regulator with XRE-family HTH domain